VALVKAKKQQREDCYKLFIDSLTRSERTKHRYLADFGYYLDWLGLTNASSLIKQKPSDIENDIIKYMKYLTKQGLSYQTINGRVFSILKFFLVNRVNLDRKYVTQFKPALTKPRKDLAYTHEQIEQLLNSGIDLRDQVMLLLLTSSGMRIGALSQLTLNDIEKIQPEGYQGKHIYKVTVYAGDRDEYYTFTTFETAAFLDSYLELRAKAGEVLRPESPLFREQFDFNSKSVAANPRFLAYTTLNTTMNRILVTSGFRKRTKKAERHLHENMSSHGCRKYFNTQCIKAGVEYGTKEFLQGRKTTRGLDTRYDRTPIVDRLSEYMKAVDFLTISPTNRLRKQVAEQEHTIKVQLVESNQQVQELRKQIEMIKNVIQKDQAQVRKIRASPNFKEKLQKG
jgi:integrase